jgi:septal ring factor EnvC (AmiA/AmiB activator)
MDDETRAAFSRMDRYFELAQQQHLDLRQDIARLEDRMGGLEQEFRLFRDWVVAEFADLRAAIRQILSRLERLERQHDGADG